MVTPDGPPNTLPPVVVCPSCRAKVPTVLDCFTGDRRYTAHEALTGYSCGHICVMSWHRVEDTSPGAK